VKASWTQAPIGGCASMKRCALRAEAAVEPLLRLRDHDVLPFGAVRGIGAAANGCRIAASGFETAPFLARPD